MLLFFIDRSLLEAKELFIQNLPTLRDYTETSQEHIILNTWEFRMYAKGKRTILTTFFIVVIAVVFSKFNSLDSNPARIIIISIRSDWMTGWQTELKVVKCKKNTHRTIYSSLLLIVDALNGRATTICCC